MKKTDQNIQEITFSVADVELSEHLLKEMPYKSAVERAIGTPIEGYPITKEKFFPIPTRYRHAFIESLGIAYNSHYPLILSPDMFWLLIAQGFAKHILLHSEEMRSVFVNHKGKQQLTVFINSFEKGRNNHWERVFPQFTEQIQDNIKADLLDTLVPEFSTTTHVEKAAFELCMMESMKDYFEYRSISICGIPQITLQGSVADWEKMIKHTQQLKGYGLDDWIERIVVILEQIKSTVNGQINRDFWDSIYKYERMSGGPYITGWITNFFPYLEVTYEDRTEEEINDIIEDMIVAKIERDTQDGYTTYKIIYRNKPFSEEEIIIYDVKKDEFPSSITTTPFIWDDQNGKSGKIHKMEFIAGFVGCTQDPKTLAIRPEISWAVRDA